MDAAMFAEIMLGGLRIELVQRQIGLAAKNAETGVRRPMPERALAATNRTYKRIVMNTLFGSSAYSPNGPQ